MDIENRLFGWILDILTMLFILSNVYWLPAVPLGHWIFRVGYWIFEDRLFGWILDILTMLFILSTVYCYSACKQPETIKSKSRDRDGRGKIAYVRF